MLNYSDREYNGNRRETTKDLRKKNLNNIIDYLKKKKILNYTLILSLIKDLMIIDFTRRSENNERKKRKRKKELKKTKTRYFTRLDDYTTEIGGANSLLRKRANERKADGRKDAERKK